MANINNSDISRGSRRSNINLHKKKELAPSKEDKYAEQEFWKRARNIRFQKQSREDNFAGDTFSEDECVPEPAPAPAAPEPAAPEPAAPEPAAPEPAPAPAHEPLDEPPPLRQPLFMTGKFELGGQEEVDVMRVPYYLDLRSPHIVGKFSASRIKTIVFRIDALLKNINADIDHFEPKIAEWSGRVRLSSNREELPFEIRLWHKDDDLLLEVMGLKTDAAWTLVQLRAFLNEQVA